MSRIIVAATLVVVWGACLAQQAGAQDFAADEADQTSAVIPQTEIARLIADRANAFRASEELGELRTSEQLQTAARYFAEFMARTGEYGHTADDKVPWERAEEHKYEACIVAENIGAQVSAKPLGAEELARGFVEGWKNSKQHRTNLLDPDVTETGVAVAKSEKTGKYYAVQMFGRPKSESIRVEVANQADVKVTYKIGDESFDLDDGAVRIHELCRPAEVIFKLPKADKEDKTEQTEVQKVNARSRLVIERNESQELKVRSAGAER